MTQLPHVTELPRLFDMREGVHGVRNILGVGDPDVHLIDGRWSMFLGGFETSFRNNIFLLRLPVGADLDSDEWSFTTYPNRPRRARPLVTASPRGAWDRYGLHEPSYVVGPAANGDGIAERIYYTGRGSRTVAGNSSPYAIGYLERTPRGWVRGPGPVITGTPARPSAMGPHVRYLEGKWRVWYCSTPNVAGRGEVSRNRIEYAESADGVSWSAPRTLFDEEDGYFHADVVAVEQGYEMVVTNGPNLFATPGYPPLGMWSLRSSSPSGDRCDWSDPVPLVEAGTDTWYSDGVFGPNLVRSGDGIGVVFFSGVHGRTNWFRLAGERLLAGRRPPVPAPYHFALGRLRVTG